MSNHPEPHAPPSPPSAVRSKWVPVVVLGAVAAVALVGVGLMVHAESKVNKVALSSSPKPVTVIVAREASFRETRTYVGTLRPWIEASVGPQFISAYVDTVLVRPGAAVKRGQVLATLDCRNASAANQAVAAEARAIDERQRALSHESSRIETLLDGGFVSPNEAEQKSAQSSSEKAQLAAQQAKMVSTNLEVSDCVLRAPFDGEVGSRSIDPGAFVRPGTALVSVIDRNIVRMTFDVPEDDYGGVSPDTPVFIRVVATGATVSGTIARRSPSADPETRTVHVEADLSDAERQIPVNTTGEVHIEVGQSRPATALPLLGASITGTKATVFVVDGDVVRKKTFAIDGEQGSNLFVETALKAGTRVVTEGRATIADGNRVQPKETPFELSVNGAPAARGADER